MHWSPAIGAEHRACREAVALFDETSFAKLDIRGDLQPLCNRTLGDVGTITYTQMTNTRGGIECDVTVARLAEDRFRIVTGTAFGAHDGAWLRTHGLEVGDVTSQYACFALWGPRARDVLPQVGVGFMRWADVAVGDVPVRAYGLSFAGEDGWELYCPMEFGARLWAALWELGQPHGIVAGGYRAIDSLRLEKGFRVWGADITPDVTPAEAGLAKGEPTRRLRRLHLEDPRAVALGNEPVRAGDEITGRVTSGGYGYTVEHSIAYALLPAATPVDLEVEVFGDWIPARVQD
jgi:4-methylaminobutanoate oxidase (formaldehyde-forming)